METRSTFTLNSALQPPKLPRGDDLNCSLAHLDEVIAKFEMDMRKQRDEMHKPVMDNFETKSLPNSSDAHSNVCDTEERSTKPLQDIEFPPPPPSPNSADDFVFPPPPTSDPIQENEAGTELTIPSLPNSPHVYPNDTNTRSQPTIMNSTAQRKIINRPAPPRRSPSTKLSAHSPEPIQVSPKVSHPPILAKPCKRPSNVKLQSDLLPKAYQPPIGGYGTISGLPPAPILPAPEPSTEPIPSVRDLAEAFNKPLRRPVHAAKQIQSGKAHVEKLYSPINGTHLQSPFPSSLTPTSNCKTPAIQKDVVNNMSPQCHPNYPAGNFPEHPTVSPVNQISDDVNSIQSMKLDTADLDVFKQYNIMDSSQIPGIQLIPSNIATWKVHKLTQSNRNAAKNYAEDLRKWGSVPQWKRVLMEKRPATKEPDALTPTKQSPDNDDATSELTRKLQQRLEKISTRTVS